MAFDTVYSVGGELDKVKTLKKVNTVEKIEEIKNFAQKNKPYNKMCNWNLAALKAVFDLEYTTPNAELELLSIVVTCTGYQEDDYYNIYVNDELWFDTWFPTEVKEGLYIGTSTYVCVLPPSSRIKLEFFNVSGTSKRIWLGLRTLSDVAITSQTGGVLIDVDAITEPTKVIE